MFTETTTDSYFLPLAMDVDSSKPSAGRITKRRVDKRKSKKSSIVFKKYSDRLAGAKKRGKK